MQVLDYDGGHPSASVPARPEVQTADVIRVDVQCEAAPSQPEAAASLTSSQVLYCTVLYCIVLYCTALYQVLRWRALLALEPDLQQQPRPSVALLDPVLVWRLPSPPPPLVIGTVHRVHDFKSQYLKQVVFKPLPCLHSIAPCTSDTRSMPLLQTAAAWRS